MKKLTLNRLTRTEKSTVGELLIDGQLFCYTLEDVDRDYNKDGKLEGALEAKVYGKTAIPAGTYKVIVDHSHHFNKLLPRVLEVPGFEGIRMHGGNTAEDSLGCILVAFHKGPGPDRIFGSASDKLTEILQQYAEIELTINM